ncbi:MAG: VCBS repeat-containing protein, partial [Planctomycetaceae bacterium]|nr:VCBS repeat-containing protein [Planctomycetaceae bacterium]
MPPQSRKPRCRIRLCYAVAALFGLLNGCDHDSSSPPLVNEDNSPLDDASERTPSDGVPDCDRFQFRSKRLESGITFHHQSGDSPEKPFPAANGSGVGILDLDLDGFSDLLFVSSNSFDPGVEVVANQCYRNSGQWGFLDVTSPTGLEFAGHSAGVTVGDFNDDGFPDVYLTCFGPNRFYENQGDGTFREVSSSSGVGHPGWGTSAAFLDYDNDGYLDLYVGNYAEWTPDQNEYCGDRERGIRMYCSPKSVAPQADVLYHNLGNGTFADVSESSQVAIQRFRTQGVIAVDTTADGLVDLYVTNDIHPNSLLINQGNGTFVNQADFLGVAYDHAGNAQAGMGVASADMDRDGRIDLFVTNFEGEHNTLYIQGESGFFTDASHLRGITSGSLPWIGWGTAAVDFNADGWTDLFVINGHTDNNMHDLGREGTYRQPPLFWENRQGKFEQCIPRDSPFFQSVHPGRGIAVADLDQDLDWDIVCCLQDLPPELLENQS